MTEKKENNLKDAVLSAIVLQVLTLFFTGLMLDGGFTSRIAITIAIFYWAVFLAIFFKRLITRNLKFSDVECQVIKFGYIILIALLFCLCMLQM